MGRGGEGRNDGKSNRAKRNEMQGRGESGGFLPKQLSMVSPHSILHRQLSETTFMAGVPKLI